MTDLITGRETLEEINFIVFCGGFSNSDVLGSAKGWAGAILYNPKAKEAIDKEPDAPVPLVIRNAPTRLMKDLSYGKGYQYAHDYEEKMTAMQCLPDSLKHRRFYHPTDQGQEARYKERLEQILAWKEEHRK